MIVVAAPGPSLQRLEGHTVLAVGDACRLFPDAVATLHNDLDWWRVYSGQAAGRRLCPDGPHHDADNRREFTRLGVELVQVDHGPCSGYAAIRWAADAGYTRIGLLGFDMQPVDGKTHFYGHRTDGLRDQGEYRNLLAPFDQLARDLRARNVLVTNYTPNSALTAFPRGAL